MEAIILTKKTRPLVWYPKAYENELFTELNQLENSKSPYIIKVHFWLYRGCKFKCKKETENTNYQIINKKAGKTRNRKNKLKSELKSGITDAGIVFERPLTVGIEDADGFISSISLASSSSSS